MLRRTLRALNVPWSHTYPGNTGIRNICLFININRDLLGDV